MLKSLLSLLTLAFLVSSCTHHGAKAPLTINTLPGRVTQQSRAMNAFNQVDIQGRINVNLHTGYKKPQVLLSGDARDLAQIKTVVTQNTLYVIAGRGVPRYGAVSADIRTSTLNRIHYQGAGILRGNQLQTNQLDLSIANQGTTTLGGHIGLRRLDVNGGGLVQIEGVSGQYLAVHLTGNPKVQIHGIVHLRQLHLDGDGWFSLYWVKSDQLVVRAKQHAKIQLAGVVNRLDVELWGASTFKGRYLRAQRSFVKTHHKSVAEITTLNHQSSLSTDASDIYYYNLPNTRAGFMAFDGSVLDMRDWSDPQFKEFTRYNKQFP